MDAAGGQGSGPPAVRERVSWRKVLRWLLILVLAVGAGTFALRYWWESRLFVSTEDAYVNGDTVEIAAQVSGPVTAVYVKDNQAVKAGQPLFDIDPEPYRIALARAEAQLQLARQGMSGSSAGVAAAQAQVAQREAELTSAQSDERRTAQLVTRGFLSQQGSETARTQVATAAAALRAAQASLAQARSALGAVGERNAGVQAAEAAVNQARLDLQRTQVAAPTDGTVANLTLPCPC